MDKLIEFIFTDEVTDLDVKLNNLKEIVSDTKSLLQIIEFLQENPVDGYSKFPFIEFVNGEQKKKLMRFLVNRGDFANLEKVVNKEEDKVKEAYRKWKNDSSPTCPTILLLGEAGVGKSTFINALVNYLKYGSLDEARQNGAAVLIKTSFTAFDKDFNAFDIKCDPNIRIEKEVAVSSIMTPLVQNQDLGDANKNDETVTFNQQPANIPQIYPEGATQTIMSYVMCFGDAGNGKSIRIIDTPGIWGDLHDNINLANIKAFISTFTEINAICVMMKPNEGRLTQHFRCSLGNTLTHLHSSALNNIFFCFTNTCPTNFTSGDTFQVLRAYKETIKAEKNITFSTEEKNVFCFDSESFRYLCSLRYNVPFEEHEKARFNRCWTKSTEETYRMLKRISELSPLPASTVML